MQKKKLLKCVHNIVKSLSTIKSLVMRDGFTILNLSASLPSEIWPAKLRYSQLLSKDHDGKNGILCNLLG